MFMTLLRAARVPENVYASFLGFSSAFAYLGLFFIFDLQVRASLSLDVCHLLTPDFLEKLGMTSVSMLFFTTSMCQLGALVLFLPFLLVRS